MRGNIATCAWNERRTASPNARRSHARIASQQSDAASASALRPRGVNPRLVGHRELARARPERHQAQVLFEPAEHELVRHRFDCRRPVVARVVEAVQAGQDDAEGVLRAGHVDRAGRVLEAEEDTRQRPGIAVRDLRAPQLDSAAAGARRHARPVVELHDGLDRDREDRPRVQLRHDRLIEPAARQIHAVRNRAVGAQRRPSSATGKSRVRNPLQHAVVDAERAAERFLRRRVPVLVRHQHVGPHAAGGRLRSRECRGPS